MYRLLPYIISILLFSCSTAEEKKQAAFKSYDKFLLKSAGIDKETKRKIDSIALFIDSIPDTLVNALHSFAVAYPKNPSSEKYLYACILKSEKAGHFFDVAKYGEDFITLFPKSNAYLIIMQKTAIRYEDVANYEKAIFYYERIAKEFPNTPEGKGAGNFAKMLKLGLITDEQKMEYIQKQNSREGQK
jgi:tetratricopeptide (TPR) repeat protein